MRGGLAILGAFVVALSACGGSSSKTSSTAGASSPAGVQACLQKAGYGVANVPAADVASGGSENRGPGQTAELLVGPQGAGPPATADDAVAVIAFWDSSAHASGSPNARDTRLGYHADAFGTVTVQPTTRLALAAARSASTPSARETAYQAALKRIGDCSH